MSMTFDPKTVPGIGLVLVDGVEAFRFNPGGIVAVPRVLGRIEYGSMLTGSTPIALNNSAIPVAAGDQYMSITVTPKRASSLLRVSGIMYLSHTTSNSLNVAAVFRDAGSTAIGGGLCTQPGSNNPVPVPFNFTVAASASAPTTFNVRGGGNTAGTTTFNGYNAVAYYAGTIKSYLLIEELPQ